MRSWVKTLRSRYDHSRFDVSDLEGITFVNIGAGITRIEGAVNVDISDKADISLVLGQEPLPFENDTVDLIYSDHTFEHVENYLQLIEEVHRVLKPGGCLLLGVPYVTLTKYHLVNPYHLHNFNEYSFDFFDPTKLRGSAAEIGAIDLRKLNHEFDYFGSFRLLPIVRNVARAHMFNVVRDVKFAITKGSAPAPLTQNIAANLASAYRIVSGLRQRYA